MDREYSPVTPHCVQVVTTTQTREDAQRIARQLVDRRLAACVQVLGPVASTFRWQGAVQSAEEWQCCAKTRAGLFERVEEAIRQLHPYEVPEILATAIVFGSKDYLDWLEAETAEG